MQPPHQQNQVPYWGFLCLFVSFSFLLVECKSGVEIQPEALVGKWIVVKGEKNDKPSLYLNNGYFSFTPPSTFRVNFTGHEEGGTYTLKSGKLSVSGHRDYYIEKFEQDTLVLRFNTSPESTFRIYAIKEKKQMQ